MKQANHKLQLTLNARTFAQAEAMGLDVLTPCATCQGNMYEDLALLLNDEKLRAEINDVLERTCGMRFEGELRMRHLLQVVVEDVGLDVLRDHVVNPIDFPVAGYYGVPMLQEGAAGDDDPMNPVTSTTCSKRWGRRRWLTTVPPAPWASPACSAESAPPCSKPQKSSLRPSKKAPWSWPPPAPESLQPRRLPGQGEEGLRSRHGPSCGSPSRIDGLRLGLLTERYAQLRTRALVMGA